MAFGRVIETAESAPARACPSCPCGGSCASLVRQLQSTADWVDSAALVELYRRGWPVVCRVIRRQGIASSDAEDLAQTFFLEVLAGRSIRHARLAGGCFRPFLIAALRHLVLKHRARERAQKRGGRLTFVPLGESEPAAGRTATAAAPEAPESALEREAKERVWTEACAQVVGRARGEAARRRAEVLFSHLGGGGGTRSLARELGISEGAVRVALHRLRRRVQQLLATRRDP